MNAPIGAASASGPPSVGGPCPLSVTVKPHPFRDHRELVELPAGQTLQELLELAQPNPVLRAHAVVMLGAHVIPRELWRRVRPKPGCQVIISVRPSGGGGGGKVALRVLLTLAVVALAVAAPYAVPALAGTLGGALLSAGIASAGPMLTNSLAPPGTSARP